MLSFPKIYLLVYNSFQAFGWLIALFRILRTLFSTQSITGAYASAGELICFLQVSAFLEVIHGALGIVPSGILFPFMQWGGRTHFVFILRNLVEVQELPSVFITFLVWSLAEVIRYAQYALNIIGKCPSWITYLRYTAFIILYPVGIGPGEMWLMYQALPYIKKKNLYGDFFAALSISYYDFLRIHFWSYHLNYHQQRWGRVDILLVCYPFLWLKLYLHMLKQRRSKLGKHRDKKNK